jgi:hypothetical protein
MKAVEALSAPDFGVIAPSKARRILQGESPCREEISNDFL